MLVYVRTKIFARRTLWRWSIPVAAVVAIALVGTGALSANASPSLPDLTAAQLLADVEQAHVAGFSGQVVENAALGLPELPSLGGSVRRQHVAHRAAVGIAHRPRLGRRRRQAALRPARHARRDRHLPRRHRPLAVGQRHLDRHPHHPSGVGRAQGSGPGGEFDADPGSARGARDRRHRPVHRRHDRSDAAHRRPLGL